MNQDPTLTPARVDALNAVDLRLIGVTHGITRYGDDGMPHVEGGSADDFDRLMAAVNELRAGRGDRLAVEPAGFKSVWDEDMTLANILPADMPDIPVRDMPQGLQDEIAAFLEEGRHGLRISNLAYTAAHTVLRGVPVHRAEVSLGEWDLLQGLLPEIAPEEARDEIRLFYRNTKMIARLGDAAIDMASTLEQPSQATDADRPVLLFASGGTHTPRLAERLFGVVAFKVK